MKIPLEWLRDFIEVKIAPEDLARKLTNHGTEVVAIEFHGKGLEGIVVGKIKSLVPHDKNPALFVCQIDIGKSLLQVMTDVLGLAVGDKVPVAPEGATIAKDIHIKKTSLHGVESFGVLCRPQELGLDLSDKILKMPLDATVGKDIRKVIGLGGYVIDIDILPNRGDCQSILGVAREVSAVTGKPLKKRIAPKIKEAKTAASSKIKIKVLDKNLCPRYMARVVRGVKVKDSPDWLKSRLLMAGLRPINNVVDVTNYLLIELGQPMHAFDLGLLSGGQIIVRCAQEKEKITTLDGVEHKLSPEMLVIADQEKPIALAGIMGGANTEIKTNTTEVLLESAFFDPISINKTSNALKIRTDSSIRFGKCVDWNMVEEALDRAAAMLVELADGEVLKGKVDIVKTPLEEKEVVLRSSRMEQLLGFTIPGSYVEKILKNLGFTVKKEKKGQWLVTIPLHRAFDVYREVDLIEEVTRIYGYDRVPTTLANTAFQGKTPSAWRSFRAKVAEVLRGAGFQEVNTFSMLGPEDLEKLHIPAQSKLWEVIHIANPLSLEESILRPVMLPSLIKVIKHNFNRQCLDVAIFEIGKVFSYDEKQHPQERQMVAAVGKDFYYIKGVMENILSGLGFDSPEIKALPHLLLQLGQAAVVRVAQKEVGNFGKVSPYICASYGVPEELFYFELDLDLLFKLLAGTKKFKPLLRFPFVTRDIALLVPKEITNQQIIDIIKDAGGVLVEEVSLFDRYVGAPIPDGFANFAYRIHFRDTEKTLTDKEILPHFEAICKALENKLKLQIRR